MRKIILLLVSLWLGAVSLFSQNIAGSWSGALEIGQQKLRLVFNITAAGGAYTSTMDSPDQGVKSIPIKETSFDGTQLKILAPDMGMTYEGTLSGETLKGIFRQSGLAIPLVMERGEPEMKMPERPQTPVAPYPYNSRDVAFLNREAGIELAGTFTWPKKGTKFPAVVLITGSGPEDRNEEVYGHKPFLVLADYLTRNGIAVLRFDDRGTAQSGGDYSSATIQDFATDVSAAMDYLKTRKEIDPTKIGLLGHSEGGQIAFIVCGKREDVAFIVTLAGPGVKGSELLMEQRRIMASLQGVPQQAIDENEKLIGIMREVIGKYYAEGVKANLDDMVKEVMASLPLDYSVPNDILEQALRRDFPAMASPELVSLQAYDPAGDLAKIKSPIFAINGDKDYQVPADMNLNGIKDRFSGDLTIKKYPGLNHLFQHSETGIPGEYAQIEETMSTEVLHDIASWINGKMN